MNELKYDKSYVPYNESINPDITTWKDYESDLRVNSHSLNEIYLPLDDAVLFGSADSAVKMNRTIPRLQLRLNYNKTFEDALQTCADDTFGQEMMD